MALTLNEGLKIIALCERIGMPWEWHPRRDDLDWAWNGEALNLAHKSPNGTSDMVHEIAHWLTASPKDRRKEDFGLSGFRRNDFDQEERASLLGILIERYLGFDWCYTWKFHNWDMQGETGWVCRKRARDLQRAGFLRGLTPVCMP